MSGYSAEISRKVGLIRQVVVMLDWDINDVFNIDTFWLHGK